jgi:hypothetical protein
MFSALALATLFIACLIVGSLALLNLLQANGRFQGDWLAWGVAAFTLGAFLVGWTAFLLAELGWFSAGAVGGVWLLLTGGLFALWLRRGQPRPQFAAVIPALAPRPPLFPRLENGRWLEPVLLLLWAAAALWLFFRPHQFIKGAADAGVYVNLAAEIAQNGRLALHDELLAAMPAELAPLFLRELGPNSTAPAYLFPAFYVMEPGSGRITPQFYHLHPVWQALAYALTGGDMQAAATSALALTGLWAAMGALALYLLARSLFGWPLALLALAGVTLNALQIWFARYPTTETLSQFLLWAGLWAVGAWLSGSQPARLWALLAGLSFGQLFLVRIDTAVILPILALLILWLWLSAHPLRGRRWFLLPLLLLSAHSLLHGYWFSRPYFLDLYGFGFRLLRTRWLIPLAGAALGVAALWILYHFRGRYGRLQTYKRPFLILLITLFAAWMAWNWFIRPITETAVTWNDPFSANAIPVLNHENLLRLGWYLSPAGIWLGTIGVCLLIWRVNRRTAVLLSITLLFTLLFITNIRANPQQIYTMRRYLVATMPLLVLGAVALFNQLFSYRKWWLSGLTALLAAGWLAGFLWSAQGFISQVDYRTLPDQLSALNAQLAEDAVLLFNDQSPISQGDLWGTPMRFLYGREVFSLRNLTPEREALLDAEIGRWQADGYTVYWLDAPAGQPDYRPPGSLIPVSEYAITTESLERSYERKPAQITSATWAGTLYRVASAP